MIHAVKCSAHVKGREKSHFAIIHGSKDVRGDLSNGRLRREVVTVGGLMVRQKIVRIDVRPKLLSDKSLQEFREDRENCDRTVRGDVMWAETVTLENRFNAVAFPRRGEKAFRKRTVEKFAKEGRKSRRTSLEETCRHRIA